MKKKQEKEIENADQDFDPSAQSSTTVIVNAQEPEKKHLGLKISLGLLTFAMVAVSVYSLMLFIIDSTKKNKSQTYLTFDGMSVNETRQFLSSYGKTNQKKIKDYGFVGTKLYFSETHITPKTIENGSFFSSNDIYTDIGLFDVLHNARNEEHTSMLNQKCYLDFSLVSPGNYLVYPYSGELSSTEQNIAFYSIDEEDAISETIYTLPDEKTGERKRISFLNNSLSPYTVIKVNEAGNQLPSDYYDMVLFYQEYVDDSHLQISDASYAKLVSIQKEIESQTQYKVKVCHTLQEALKVRATYSFALAQNTIEKPVMTFLGDYASTLSSSTFKEGSLQGYDNIPEIREVTGYLGKGSLSYYGITGNDTEKASFYRYGKEGYLVNDETSSVLDVMAML
ncbi:MAG: hypothetical protein SPI51_04580 [Candidatus Enterosoma sp.]|nr:hypothetical protein [Candidatus Enterosoma sp.]